MELEIKVDSDTENKLMGRREIAATATYTGSTPSRDIIKQELCKKLNLKPDSTAVVRISQIYGTMSSGIILHGYSTRETMLAFEKEGRKKDDAKAKEQKPAAEKPAEEKEEKKAEAKKEEKKEEKAEK